MIGLGAMAIGQLFELLVAECISSKDNSIRSAV